MTLVTDSETRTLEYQHSLWGDEFRDGNPEPSAERYPFHLSLDELDAQALLDRAPDARQCEKRLISVSLQATPEGGPLVSYRCALEDAGADLAVYLGDRLLPEPTVTGEAALLDAAAWDSVLTTARDAMGTSWFSIMVAEGGERSIQVGITADAEPPQGKLSCEGSLQLPLGPGGSPHLQCNKPLPAQSPRTAFSPNELSGEQIATVLSRPGVELNGPVFVWREPGSGQLVLQCVVDGEQQVFDLATAEPLS